MKNVFVCIPLEEGKQVEIQPISYDTKREVVALYEKFEKILKCDLSANIRSIYSNRSSISIMDTNNDDKPEYIFYYVPEASWDDVVKAVEKILASACKEYTMKIV
jgi:hypothetical protein